MVVHLNSALQCFLFSALTALEVVLGFDFQLQILQVIEVYIERDVKEELSAHRTPRWTWRGAMAPSELSPQQVGSKDSAGRGRRNQPRQSCGIWWSTTVSSGWKSIIWGACCSWLTQERWQDLMETLLESSVPFSDHHNILSSAINLQAVPPGACADSFHRSSLLTPSSPTN